MTVIVASLFLPYQPQFEVSTSDNEAAQLAESQLVKLNNLSDVGRAKQLSTVDSVADLAKTVEPVSSAENAVQTRESLSADGMVSSNAFIENLTANATASATPGNIAVSSMSRNASVEEFFSLSKDRNIGSPNLSNLSSPAGDEAAGTSAIPGGPGADTTASLLKNVNKSLIYQSILSKNSSRTSLEGHSMYHSSSPNSAVITPKSKALPDVSSAVVNFAKVKQQQQEIARLPSMRRVTRTTGGSKLKYSSGTIDSGIESAPGKSTPPEMAKADYDPDDDSDLEIDSSLAYRVPRFGGYSNNAKLRASLLTDSYELFRHIPWKIVPGTKGNGGLKNAFETAIVEKTITEPVSWVGTIGVPTDEIPDDVVTAITKSLAASYSSTAVITDDITFKSAYKNFSKQILWPTLHYEIPDNPNSKAFEDHSWNYYKKLNQQFADKIVSAYKDGDTIWIQDYHLMLVPEMVRRVIPNAKIGFFFHVSFPSSEVFRCLAQREKILEGILGANFVGFQTKEYARHFLQTSNRLLMTDINNENLNYKGRVISVNHCPMGIDFFNLHYQMSNEKTLQWRQLIKEKWKDKFLIVCRDQFDPIRGLDKKMLAYERFLIENPEYIERVVFLQICIGASKNPELERQIMVIVDRINSLSSDLSVSHPVVFLHQDLDFEQYLAINCEADMFFVNALREGMNLTCHEFIACSEEKNSPLLLSEFTGSAEVLKDGAILINPWDIRSVARAIKRGLEMSFEEKRRLWKNMVKSIIRHDSDSWVNDGLQNISSAWEFNQEISRVFYLSKEQLYADYTSTKKHMFIFKISEPPTARMISILNELSSKNIVYVINSFSKTTLETLYNRVLNIGLIAENGAYVRLNGTWYNIVEQVEWKSEVVKILDDKAERLPGSYSKVSDSMIRFHTENAEDKDRITAVVGEAITHINTLYAEKGIHAYVHKNIVFVQQVGLSLAAVQFLLKFYNSTTDAFNKSGHVSTPSVMMTPNAGTRGDHFTSNDKSQYHVEFACVAGSSSPVVEPLFQLLQDESSKGILKHVHGIVYGNSATSTFAKEHVDGANELFTVLQHITKL